MDESLIFHVAYLGTDQPSLNLNFSKNANMVVAQYYQVQLMFLVMTALVVAEYVTMFDHCHINIITIAVFCHCIAKLTAMWSVWTLMTSTWQCDNRQRGTSVCCTVFVYLLSPMHSM